MSGFFIEHDQMKNFILLLFVGLSINAWSQAEFSLATDLSVLRNLNKGQEFWTIGQTVKGNFHFTDKTAAYVWLSYYGKASFRTPATAEAKSPFTNPQSINYSVRSSLRYRQISVGAKRYFKGTYRSDDLNIYGYAGFGLMLGKVDNVFRTAIDTSRYAIAPPVQGSGKFNRLTFDVGLGTEYPVATDIYLYSELRSWIPSSGYPSDYLRNNKNVPSIVALNIGARLLF